MAKAFHYLLLPRTSAGQLLLGEKVERGITNNSRELGLVSYVTRSENIK